MRPWLLKPVLSFLGREEPDRDLNDFAPRPSFQTVAFIRGTRARARQLTPKFVPFAARARAYPDKGHVPTEVEFCSGDGEFSAAMWSSGFHGKALDATRLMCCRHLSSEVRYSHNHDFLRTVGFVTLLASAPRLQSARCAASVR